MKIITLYTLIKEEVHILRRRYRGQLHNPRHPRRHIPLSNRYQTIAYYDHMIIRIAMMTPLSNTTMTTCSDRKNYLECDYILNIYLGQEDSGLVRCFAILAGFFIFLIIVQYGTFSKHLKVSGFGFMADYYFDALDGK